MFLFRSSLKILLTINVVLSYSFGVELEKQVRKFPSNFKFGLGTSSYQVEGGWDADGKGPSIWDTYTHNFPERIADRSNGDVAVDSYHLYKEDVTILKNMGANFYRFSFNWPRILPNGDISSLNAAGINYYHNLIDELIQNGIDPMPTIYHWELPQYLQNLGGWTNPLIADYFVAFANLLFKEYGMKIKQWITFNEPLTFCSGYGNDLFAPNLPLGGVGDYLCSHHVLISHARTYHLYKNKYFPTMKGKIGITLNSYYYFPNDKNNKDDEEAAERCTQFYLGLFSHPIFSKEGDYPSIVRKVVDKNSADEGRAWSRLPRFDAEMVKYIRGTADFFGLNYYTSRIVQPTLNNNFPTPSIAGDASCNQSINPKWPRAQSSWLYSVPEGLFQQLLWIRKSYGNIEILITENGWSDDGDLEDDGRITYLNEHFDAVLSAIEVGVNVTGHGTWSLLDNFEWSQGYTEKFGIVRVDIDDPCLTRIPKKSVAYLEQVFKTKEITVQSKINFENNLILSGIYVVVFK